MLELTTQFWENPGQDSADLNLARADVVRDARLRKILHEAQPEDLLLTSAQAGHRCAQRLMPLPGPDRVIAATGRVAAPMSMLMA